MPVKPLVAAAHDEVVRTEQAISRPVDASYFKPMKLAWRT